MSIVTGAGRRDKRITIQDKTETRGADYSEVIPTWVDHATVWAQIEPLSGREYFLNREQQTDVTVRIRILYFTGINNRMRVIYRDKIYQVVSVIDPLEQHEELELICSDFEQTVT